MQLSGAPAAPSSDVVVPVASYGVLPPAHPCAADVVLRFIDALNSRDLSCLLTMLAEDCLHEDLAHEAQARGKEEVARFYADVMSSMPERVRVVVDDFTGGDPVKVGLTWHMEVDGVEVPCSRGMSFYRVRPAGWDRGGALSCSGAGGGGGGGGLITYVRQSPEHFIKLSGVVLSASASATPLIDSLGPMVLPNFWVNLARGASNMLASAPPVEEVLRNLAAAGATNTVPSVADLMGMAAAAAAGGGGDAGVHVGGGGAAAAAASAYGMHRGGGGGGGGAFSTMGPAATVAPAGLAYMPRNSFPGSTALAAGGASAAHPHGHRTRAPAAKATAVTSPAAAPAAAATAAADASAAPARASPVVFAASVALAERPPASTSTSGGSSTTAGGCSDAAASLASSGSVHGSVGSADFDLAQLTASAAAYGRAATGVTAAPAASGDIAAGVTATRSEAVAAAPEQLQSRPQAHQAAEALVGAPVMDEGAVAAASVPVVPAVPMSSLAGIWEKDLEASDVAGYEKALDLWQISGVQKATARLIEGLELALRDGAGGRGGAAAFDVHFLTIIPYFKVTESYPLAGGRAKMRRRDQRSGDAQAHAEALPNGVMCRAAWGAPFAGELLESYTLPDPAGQPDLMHVSSTIRVGGKEATTVQVYHRRRNMSARDLISASEKRNGKANDVLKRFGM
ncbi:hypothetical protein PLESTB_000895500 [Pleodorina starrii]|uniref:SnoaL-like domain-containing protein n=1 Tax=Pleodorina starrii TaxID=330485 RepID=A0A9W6F351_9CHLO|nr:hypothetical protein PLESTM_000885500 [Pleodorina starrii]GLC54687.1 hypothetical protein PLESTB_000895500 [Pleodorina starrii]